MKRCKTVRCRNGLGRRTASRRVRLDKREYPICEPCLLMNHRIAVDNGRKIDDVHHDSILGATIYEEGTNAIELRD